MSPTPPKLVSTGAVIVDLVMELASLPARGGDVLARSAHMTAGGGYNVMLAARRQGMAVDYAGRHGTGPLGDLVRAALDGAGIAALLEPTVHADTGFDIVMVEPGGERTFATALGAESVLSPEDLDRVKIALDDWLYVSGYSLLSAETGSTLGHWLAGISPTTKVIVDPGPLVGEIGQSELDAVWAVADWWSCNQREATLLTGFDDPCQAAIHLSRLHASRSRRVGIVVRAGAGGCALVEPGINAARVVPGFATEVIDTTGAGDTHVGVFVAALAAGQGPVGAATRANAAAAMAISRLGPATAPSREELDELLGRPSTARS